MRADLRKVFVSFVESPMYRRWTRSGVGRSVLRSRPYRTAVDLKRRAAISASRRRSPDLFERTRTCFFLVGHTKSGGSLLGGLLDAHRDVVCADELGMVQLLAEQGDREAAFRLAVRNSEREALKGRVTARRLEPYSFAVPGEHQGKPGSPLAVGDSKAGPTTRYLAAHPTAYARVQEAAGPVSVRVLQVVRNPFDPIAAMVIRGHRTVHGAIDDYRDQCERLVALSTAFDKLHLVRYENVVADPRAELADVCRFLGVEADAAYVDACAGVVDATPRLDRHRIDWDGSAIGAVERLISEFTFLGGYTFEEVR